MSPNPREDLSTDGNMHFIAMGRHSADDSLFECARMDLTFCSSAFAGFRVSSRMGPSVPMASALVAFDGTGWHGFWSLLLGGAADKLWQRTDHIILLDADGLRDVFSRPTADSPRPLSAWRFLTGLWHRCDAGFDQLRLRQKLSRRNHAASRWR